MRCRAGRRLSNSDPFTVEIQLRSRAEGWKCPQQMVVQLDFDNLRLDPADGFPLLGLELVFDPA